MSANRSSAVGGVAGDASVIVIADDAALASPPDASPRPALAKRQQQQQRRAAAKKATAAVAAMVDSDSDASAGYVSGSDGASGDDTKPKRGASASKSKRGTGKQGTAANNNKSGSSTAAAAAAAAAATFTDGEVLEARDALLAWYDRAHRVLPWRRNPHSKRGDGSDANGSGDASGSGVKPAPADLAPQAFAYRVWVSEIMLQQTQVATVIPYFERWLARWPTVAALAAASQDDVNQVWAGLGYYRRARYLLDGAKHVADKLGGSFPTTAEGLRAIPGVGPYTAAAVASIAFSDRAAAVDGNVVRVVSRLRALAGDPTKNARAVEALAARLLDPSRPGCHNQAMMELGATVCKPANPLCGECPVAGVCAAARRVADHAAAGGDPNAAGAPRATDFPEKVVKAAKREQHVAVCVVKAWVPAAAATQAAAAGATDGSSGAGGGGSGAAPAAKKRRTQQQSSILAFVSSKRGDGDNGASAAANNGGGGADGTPAGANEEALARGGAVAYYLLAQRPPAGLLAGLWECPSAVVSDSGGNAGAAPAPEGGAAAAASGTPAARRALADALLRDYGVATAADASGSGGVRVVARRQLGSFVHVFSHIRQTAHVEELVLAAPSLADACARARGGGDGGGASGVNGGSDGGGALKWVSARDVRDGGEGLTAGVRKALELAKALGGGGGKGKGKGNGKAKPE